MIFYYSTTLWKSVGFEESDSFLIAVITSLANILATDIAIALIDFVGRKVLLVGGSTLMTFALGFMALGVGAAAQWGANFVVSTTFPMLAEARLQIAYRLYAAFALLSFFFVVKFVRETKGRTLEHMTL